MKPHIKKVDGLWYVVNLGDIYNSEFTRKSSLQVLRAAVRAEKANAFCTSKNLKEKR